MSQKISVEEISTELSKLINEAQIYEPLLAERLKVLSSWIRNLSPGKLRSKKIYKLLVDLSMATDLIVGNKVGMCLCVQLTTVHKGYLQEKLTEWEKTLRHWDIERGLLVSYIPNSDCEVRLAKIILSANDTLGVGQYKMKESN